MLNIQEREVAMGFPKDFTLNSVPKGDQGSKAHLDTRLTLIGNSWNVTAVSWLLSQLGQRLGLNDMLSVQDVLDVVIWPISLFWIALAIHWCLEGSKFFPIPC